MWHEQNLLASGHKDRLVRCFPLSFSRWVPRVRAWWVFRRAVDGVRAGHASVHRKPRERFPQRIATTSVWAWVPPCATYHLRLLVRHGGHFARAELQAAQQQPGLLGAEPRVRLGPRKIKRKKFLP